MTSQADQTVNGFIRQMVSVDDSQFGFVPGRYTTDAVARVIPSSRQDALYGLCGPKESIRQCPFGRLNGGP